MNNLQSILWGLCALLCTGCGNSEIETPTGDRIPIELQGEWVGKSPEGGPEKPVVVTSSVITAHVGYSEGAMLFHVRGSGDAAGFEFGAVFDDHACEGALAKAGDQASLTVTCENSGLDGAEQREKTHQITLSQQKPFSQ
jgi:hypothetical protein